jgi:hypothetical protein
MKRIVMLAVIVGACTLPAVAQARVLTWGTTVHYADVASGRWAAAEQGPPFNVDWKGTPVRGANCSRGNSQTMFCYLQILGIQRNNGELWSCAARVRFYLFRSGLIRWTFSSADCSPGNGGE